MYLFFKNALFLCFIMFSAFPFCSNGQNCGIPQHLKLSPNDSLRRECAEINDILGNISASNVHSVFKINTNPHDLQLDFVNQRLIVKVKRRLCPATFDQNQQSFIDKTWSNEIEIQVELNCTDNRMKLITIVIPIKDENTQNPFFESSDYNLTMEPCFIGTHLHTCPINFEFPITVNDHDRDEENAVMELYTTRPDVIQITTTNLQEDNYKHYSDKVRRRQMKVYLYLAQVTNSTENKNSTLKPLTFDLVACNKQKSPEGEILCGTAQINLTFEKILINAPGNCVGPPVFKSSVYHAQVNSLERTYIGAELQILPNLVFADAVFEVTYVMDSACDIFKIDAETGRVTYEVNLTERTDVDLWSDVKIYNIKAYLKSFGADELYSIVPLVVRFNVDYSNGNGTEGPIEWCSNSTVGVTECPTTTTTESICPTVTCPTTSQTCGASTTEMGDYNVTTTTTDWTTNSTISSTVMPNRTTTTEMEHTSTLTPTTEQGVSNSTPLINTTTVEYNTTSEMSSTTEVTFLPTVKPCRDDCCGYREIIANNFTCPSSLPNGKSESYPDPYDCSSYHVCHQVGGIIIDNQKSCQDNLVYCPKFKRCLPESECCEGCDDCQCDDFEEFLPPGDENNICGGNEFYSDPEYCDVWHHCVPSGNGTWDYLDYLKQCGQGTFWCPTNNKCQYRVGYDGCDFDPCLGGLIPRPKKCNLCQPKINRSKIWTFINKLLSDKNVTSLPINV